MRQQKKNGYGCLISSAGFESYNTHQIRREWKTGKEKCNIKIREGISRSP